MTTMTNAQIIGFCAACLAVVALVSSVVFPRAAMSVEQRARLDTPQPASALPAIDLGRVYGKVPVATLLDAYLSKKAKAEPAGSGEALPQFGGC